MKHWKKVLALVLLAGIVCLCVFDWARVKSDFYPLDRSFIAPNIMAALVQWAVILILAALLYPPTRRAIERFVGGHVQSIKDHVSAEHAAVHAKMDHIIAHHPDIPPFGSESPPKAATSPAKASRVRKSPTKKSDAAT